MSNAKTKDYRLFYPHLDLHLDLHLDGRLSNAGNKRPGIRWRTDLQTNMAGFAS